MMVNKGYFDIIALVALAMGANYAQAATTTTVQQAKQESCKALVMSGGANNGAWEAGVLWGFVNYGNASDFEYDVVTGVSVGSLNSLFVAGYPKGQEMQLVNDLSDLWLNLQTSDVFVNWPLSPVQGLLNKNGLLDNRPLLNYMKNLTADWTQLYRRITLSALDIESGKINFFDQDNTSVDEFYKAAFASTCIPGLFPSYNWTRNGKTQMFNDNYMVQNSNPYSAIEQCMQLVDDKSKITIDVLLLGSMQEFEVKPEHSNSGWFGSNSSEHDSSFSNFMRGRDIKYQYNNSNSIIQVMRANSSVNWRYILQQENANSGINQIRFDSDSLWPLQEEGRQVAKEALTWPEGLSAIMYQNWVTTQEVNKEQPSFQEYMNSIASLLVQ